MDGLAEITILLYVLYVTLIWLSGGRSVGVGLCWEESQFWTICSMLTCDLAPIPTIWTLHTVVHLQQFLQLLAHEVRFVKAVVPLLVLHCKVCMHA